MKLGNSTRAPQDIFYYVTGEWYKGPRPPFDDASKLPGTKILEDNFPAIKAEVESYYSQNADRMKPNFAYSYVEERWKTVTLYSYFLRYRSSCERFPVTDSVVRQIPGMCLAQISVLEPNVRIRSHFGDTDATIRSHLGLTIPGTLPELGFALRRQKIAWREGTVFSFCIAHRHYAWNYTDKPRLVLLVDVVREEHMDRRFEIASKVLAATVTKLLVAKFGALRKAPVPVTRAVHRLLTIPFRVLLETQQYVDLPIERLVRLKVD